MEDNSAARNFIFTILTESILDRIRSVKNKGKVIKVGSDLYRILSDDEILNFDSMNNTELNSKGVWPIVDIKDNNYICFYRNGYKCVNINDEIPYSCSQIVKKLKSIGVF